MKTRILTILFCVLSGGFYSADLYGQCSVTASAYPTTVCVGDPVTLSSTGACGYLMYNDFNNGTAGAGWVATNGVSFANPCNPTSDGTIYMWMGDAVPLPRTLTTVAFNVNGACEISFDMKYATQSQASPCEGIDEYNEGISLQYSINGGATWVDIVYFQPDGVFLTTNPGTSGTCISSPYITPFTSWATYNFPVPTAAQTPSTKFRWVQIDYSSQSNDHWGLDNIEILCPANVLVQWDHGPTVFDPPQEYPTQDTWYVVEITDTVSGLTAIDSVFVNVVPVPTSDFTVTSPVCTDGFSTITYTGVSSSAASFNWLFSGGTILSGSGEGPYNISWPAGGTMWISLEVGDSGCYSPTTYDSIVVSQAPTAGFAADIQEGCDPLVVNFTDLSSPPGSIWKWNFGDLATATIQNPTHTYTTPGLFDVTLIVTTPQGCDDTLTNSNFIHVFDQPDANLTATPSQTSIVDPEITFTSTSAGVADWFWDFGDGETSLLPPAVTHEYASDGTFNVMLIVASADGCVDTAYTSVLIIAEPEFYNVITPDGNGQNDKFVIFNADRIPGKLQIFNRWGKRIWQSEGESYLNDFDGEDFADGTYYYIYTYGVNMENEHQGTLTILRQ